MAFKPGDVVIYTNERSRQKGYNNGQEYEPLVGKLAEVVEDERHECARVKWLDDVSERAPTGLYPDNLKLYVAPTKEEIANAIALLKRAGEVTFKPKFKDWKKGVDLNTNHRAEVSVTSQGLLIKVGCQTFLPEAVEGLARVVAEARQYQMEQCGD